MTASNDLKTEHDVHLTRPFQYSKGGEAYEASFVRLQAPTARHRKQCAEIKQAFDRTAAAFHFQGQERAEAGSSTDEGEGSGFDGLTALDVVTMLSASPNVEYARVLEVAVDLFTREGVAMVDGEVKLTRHLVDSMHQDDFELLLGEYVVNFTLASRRSLIEARKSTTA